jgi:GNAT superfamily N-acetyltransferase
MEIRDYVPADAAAFRELNVDWIRKHFAMEAPDYELLDRPDEAIIQPGGRIFMAFEGDRAVGCCALVPVAPGVFELAKMTVAEEFRGRGVGRRILDHAVDQARRAGASRLVLETNHKLEDAIHLYQSAGFRHVEAGASSSYGRADVHMALNLR